MEEVAAGFQEAIVPYYDIQGMNSDGTFNPDKERLVDIENLIDYMIITYYTGDRDGPGSRYTQPRPNNYFGIYNRENPQGFKFFEHDSEHSLGELVKTIWSLLLREVAPLTILILIHFMKVGQ